MNAPQHNDECCALGIALTVAVILGLGIFVLWGSAPAVSYFSGVGVAGFGLCAQWIGSR